MERLGKGVVKIIQPFGKTGPMAKPVAMDTPQGAGSAQRTIHLQQKDRHSFFRCSQRCHGTRCAPASYGNIQVAQNRKRIKREGFLSQAVISVEVVFAEPNAR